MQLFTAATGLRRQNDQGRSETLAGREQTVAHRLQQGRRTVAREAQHLREVVIHLGLELSYFLLPRRALRPECLRRLCGLRRGLAQTFRLGLTLPQGGLQALRIGGPAL